MTVWIAGSSAGKGGARGGGWLGDEVQAARRYPKGRFRKQALGGNERDDALLRGLAGWSGRAGRYTEHTQKGTRSTLSGVKCSIVFREQKLALKRAV